uniref:Peptide chain release factor domain-containing protein n=1 Tax=Ciona savignyi TaxID=51511 RepID=H2ZFF2_CIOSA
VSYCVQNRLVKHYKRLLLPALNSGNKLIHEIPKFTELTQIAQNVERLLEKINDRQEIENLLQESKDDPDMLKEVQEERINLDDEIADIKSSIIDSLIVEKDVVNNNGALLEVTPGIGGIEAALFAMDIFEMYQKFCHRLGFEFDVVECDVGENNALVKASVVISSGDGYAYSLFRHEAGIHRVQRVPKTEKAGRVHTSTASVAVFPRSAEELPPLQKKDLKITYGKASGAGGQHVNSTLSSAVVCHIPSGIIVKVEDTRYQKTNLERALNKLTHIIHTKAIKENQEKVNSARRKQTGSTERSDKIRTYNFHHSRITDHRIGFSVNGMDEFLKGGVVFENLLRKLEEHHADKERTAVMNA